MSKNQKHGGSPGNELRFAVGSREDIRSSVWRVWAKGDDLYLAARSFAAVSKVSFHRSGIYRFAVNSTTPRPALFKWTRPPETFPGWTVVFGIRIPPLVTEHPLRAVIKDQKPMHFIDAPIAGSHAIFQITLSHKNAELEELIRLPNNKKMNVHGNVIMECEKAWLTSHYQTVSPKDHSDIADHFEKIKIHLKSGSTGEGLSAFAHLFQLTDGRASLIDIQLGTENLDFSARGT